MRLLFQSGRWNGGIRHARVRSPGAGPAFGPLETGGKPAGSIDNVKSAVRQPGVAQKGGKTQGCADLSSMNRWGKQRAISGAGSVSKTGTFSLLRIPGTPP